VYKVFRVNRGIANKDDERSIRNYVATCEDQSAERSEILVYCVITGTDGACESLVMG
jgi:hypothetical protein